MCRKWGTVALLVAVGGLNYANRTALSVVLPQLRTDLHISDLAIGSAGACFLWSYAAGCPFAGYLGDRLRRDRIIFWSLLLSSLIMIVTALVKSVPQLLVMRALLGVVDCAFVPASYALIGDYHETKTRGTALGIHQSGFNLGLVGGGYMVGLIAEDFNWRYSFLAIGGVGLVLAGIVHFYLRDPFTTSSKTENEAFIQHVFKPLRVPSVAVVVGEATIVAAATWIFLNWLPLYFFEVHHLSLAVAGFSGPFAMQFPSMIGAVLGGRLSDSLAQRGREYRMRMLGIGMLIAAPFALVFMTGVNVGVIGICLAAYSISLTLGTSNEIPILCDLLPRRERASAFAAIICGCNIAGGIAMLGSGYLKPVLGLRGLFSLATLILVIAASLCLIGYNKWMRKNLQETAVRCAAVEAL
jgi:MFS family permease